MTISKLTILLPMIQLLQSRLRAAASAQISPAIYSAVSSVRREEHSVIIGIFLCLSIQRE